MNLLSPMPDWAVSLLPEPAVYALPFDIDEQGRTVDGWCAATRSELLTLADQQIVKRIALTEISDLATEQLVGSGSLYAKTTEGASYLVCVFSHRYLAQFAELAGALLYTHRTGDVVTEVPSDEEMRLCPKCGTPIPPGSTQCVQCMKKGKTLLRLFKFCGPYRKTLTAAIVLAILCEALYIILPYMQRIVIDDFITPRRQDWPAFGLLVLLGVGIVLGLWICDWISGRCSVKAATSIARDLRSRVFSKIQAMSMNSLSRRTTGELINRVTGDTQRIQNFIVDYGRDFIVQTCGMLVVLVLLFVTNWKLALLVLAPIPPVVVLVFKLQQQVQKRYQKTWPKWDESNAVLHDVLSGVQVIKTFGTEERETQRYAKASWDMNSRMMRADVFWFCIMPLLSFLITFGEFVLLYFGGHMILDGELQLGELVQFTMYVGYLYGPLRWYVRLPKMVADATISAGKIFDVLDEKTDLLTIDKPKPLDIHGEVTFQDVCFGYKVYQRVLKHVSFTVKPGEMIGIVGHSGAGKTTLINLIMRLYDPGEGRILLDGVDLRELDPYEYRNRVGVVLQESFLFAGTIFENIAFSKPGATMQEVVTAAKIGGAHDFIVKMPDGYNTRVGDKGYTLSGGERQRVSIARAVLHDPALLILDEATASLDTETEKQIQEAIARVSHGRTTFAIAHRLSTLRNADRLLVIDKGELVEMGTHLELMQNKGGVYYNLVMAQRQTAKIRQ